MSPFHIHPDSMVHGANMGPIWGRQDPGGPHFGPMNFTIWVWINTACEVPCDKLGSDHHPNIITANTSYHPIPKGDPR